MKIYYKSYLYIYIYKEKCKTVANSCVLPPRSARRKTLNRPSAILDLRRKYTIFRARSYACNAKEKPQRLFANSSRERRRIATKLSKPSNTVPHLDLRGSACANKLLPRNARRRNPPHIRHLGSTPWEKQGACRSSPATFKR